MKFHIYSRSFVIFCLLLTIILLPNPLDKFAWADSQCELDGMEASDGALGYNQRQYSAQSFPRCEGLYRSPVNSKFEVLSLLWGSIAYKNDSILHVHWPSQSSLPGLFITGKSKIPGIFYRMDAKIDGNLPFHWPVSEVLAKTHISSHELGLFGWVKNNEEIVYIPLAVTNLSQGNEKPSDRERMTLIIRAGSDLERVIVRKVGGSSKSKRIVIQEQIDAGEPISIDLSDLLPSASGKDFSLQIRGKVIDNDRPLLETIYLRVLR